MTKNKRYWWRVDGKVVYGEWTGCTISQLLWMRTKDGELWGVHVRDVMSEDREDWSFR